MSRVSQAFYQGDSRWFAAVERLLHRRVDIATGNAQAILRELSAEGIPDRKLRLVRNGIDPATFARSMIGKAEARNQLGVPRDALVFTSVANYYPYKGHADLLDALHLLKDRLPVDWRLLAPGRDVIGNLETLRLLARKQALDDKVLFLGERRDIPVVLSAADVHVSASHHEGFPNNILEAMCAGLPVVATAIGGVVEQVVDGVTGLLVPPRNSAALAAALYALSCDPARRASMGGAGRERVAAAFPIDCTVAALEQAYARCAEQRAARISPPSGSASALP